VNLPMYRVNINHYRICELLNDYPIWMRREAKF
jgi:hypothetical protein